MKKSIIMTLCLLMAGILTAQVTAQAPPGTGTEADPYLISSANHLLWMATPPAAWYVDATTPVYFTQTQNIDASGTHLLDSGNGMRPISVTNSSASAPFYGVYDGGGFNISDLKINMNSGMVLDRALFALIDDSIIKDLHLVNFTIDHTNTAVNANVGSIVGIARNGSEILNCSAAGTIRLSNQTNAANIGGIIGQLQSGSLVTNLHSAVTIDLSGDFTGRVGAVPVRVGGIVSLVSASTIEKSYYSGDIKYVAIGNDSERTMYIGGIASQLMSSSTIDQCFFSGNILGEGVSGRFTVFAGGIVSGVLGDSGNVSTISNSYSAGVVKGISSERAISVGGILGESASSSANVLNNFATGYIEAERRGTSGTIYVGGIAGALGIGSTVAANCYWDTETTNQEYGMTTGSNLSGVSNVVGKTTAEMKTLATFLPEWNFDTIWGIEHDINYGYPHLQFKPFPIMRRPANFHRTNAENEFEVALAWDEPVGYTGTLIEYKIYKNDVAVSTQTENTFTDETPGTHGENIVYHVTAVYANPDGESAPSTALNITVYNPVFNPPRVLVVTETSTAMIKLAWELPADGSTGTLAGFNVYRKSDTDIEAVFIDTVNNPSYDDDISGEVFEEYEYYVTAVYANPAGESVPSDKVSVSFISILPVTLSEFGAVNEENGIKIHWTAETETNMTGYRVKRAEIENVIAGVYITALIPASNLSFTQNYHYLDTDVVNGKEYFYWLEAIENDGTIEVFGPLNITAVLTEDIPIPITTMSSAYPNPMNIGTSAHFDISIKANETAELRIYNIRGQVVRSYENLPAGHQTIIWDARDLNGKEVSSGVYFYRLTSPTSHVVQRMVVVK